jgi:hypothetical protein
MNEDILLVRGVKRGWRTAREVQVVILDEACSIPDHIFAERSTMGEVQDEGQAQEGVTGTPVVPPTPAPDIQTDDTQADETAAAEEAADPALTGDESEA